MNKEEQERIYNWLNGILSDLPLAYIDFLISQRDELAKEMKTALSLIRLKYGNLDPQVWEWQEKVFALLSQMETAVKDGE